MKTPIFCRRVTATTPKRLPAGVSRAHCSRCTAAIVVSAASRALPVPTEWICDGCAPAWLDALGADRPVVVVLSSADAARAINHPN